MNTANLSKLAKPEDMNELHLLNTLKFSISNFSNEIQKIWNKRKLDCKMELMKRWTKELQENGIQPKIVFKEPESKHDKKYSKELLNNDSIFDAVFKN